MDTNNPIASPPSHDAIDLNKLFIILRSNWLWIALVIVAINAGAYLFIRYTKNVYESESELKLDVKEDASDLGIKEIVEDKNVNIVSGEIEIIQSKLFLSRVASQRDFEVSFFSVGHVLDDELFHNAPARVTPLTNGHPHYDVPIRFEELNTRTFALQLVDGRKVSGTYNEPLNIDGLGLIITRNPKFLKGQEIGYYFVVNSQEALLDYLRRNLTAEPLNINANTIRIAFRDHNPFKAEAVLNKIDTLYLQYSNEQKNLANKQKIDWLTGELDRIEKRMDDYEDYFENFTLKNRTSDLDEDLERTIASINAVDSQRYEISRKISEVDRLITGLDENIHIYPISLHQSFHPALQRDLEELEQLQASMDRLKLSHSEITFAFRQKEGETERLKAKVAGQLETLKTDWTKRLRDLNRRKATLEDEFAGMPDKNTEYTKHQRFYKLYEQFYLLLMESKSQFEIAQAGSTPDFKILSPATFSMQPVSPNDLMVAGAGAVASLVCSLFLVGVLYLANNKITGMYELDRVNSAPLLGTIPLSKHVSDGLHILDHPRSMVSEAIRTLRTNLDFFNVGTGTRVIAISSTVSGEGKSFIALNLGGMMALSNKKVILLDLDMRKAKTNLPATTVDPSMGVSTVLIKKNPWEACVLKTPLENFDMIPSGPHPPNPAELLMNGAFSQLISDLKTHYDYILLDTPPVGLVTDGIMAMKQADVSIYVFRANYSRREFLMNLRRIININKFQNITTLLNAVPAVGKTYGYGYYDEKATPRKLKSIFKA